jgi:hypothetical protein
MKVNTAKKLTIVGMHTSEHKSEHRHLVVSYIMINFAT